MKTIKTLLAIGAGATMLSACSVENCDNPATDGLGAALACVTNADGYEAQTQELAAEANARQGVAAQLRAENAQLNRDLNQLNAEQRALSNRIAASNSRLATLDDALNRQLRNQQISQAEFDLAQNQLNDLLNRMPSVGSGSAADAARVSQLEAEVADLEGLFE